MSGTAETTNLDRERDLLQEELLPDLKEKLGDYEIVNVSDEYQDGFQRIVEDDLPFDEYELPTIKTSEFGVIFPEYFIVKGDHSVSYAAAIEPHTKYIHIQDAELSDVLRGFAERWKEQSHIDEIDLGRADVSNVSFAENESSTVFAERL